MKKNLFFWVMIAGGLAACATRPVMVPKAVKIADVMGDWYVSAHVPHWSEKDCYASLLRLRQLPDLRIDTRYIAHKKGIYGRKYLVKGMSEVRDPRVASSWDFRFVSGLYGFQGTFLEVAKDGRYAVLMTPNRRRAWILSRQRSMSGADFAAALRVLDAQGFSIRRLVPVPQIPWA